MLCVINKHVDVASFNRRVVSEPAGQLRLRHHIGAVRNEPVLLSRVGTSLYDVDLHLSRPAVQQILCAMLARAEQLPLPAISLKGRRSYQVNPETVVLLKGIALQLAKRQAQTLDIRETALLSLQLEKVARLLPSASPLAELCQRLALQSQAAWAQLAHAEAQRQLLPQWQCYERPGAASNKQGRLSVGMVLGVDAGIGVGVHLGLQYGQGISNDDEGTMLETRSAALSASVSVSGDLGVASLTAGLEGQVVQTSFQEFNSAAVFVKLNAQKLVPGSRQETLDRGARRVSWLRTLLPRYRNELWYYRRVQQRAADQQQRLGVLLGWLGQRDHSAALPGARATLLLGGQSRRVMGRGHLAGAALGSGGAASVAMERNDIHMPLLTPYWQALRAPHGVARNPTIACQRLAALERRAQPLFDRPQPGLPPLRRLIGYGVDSIAGLRDCTPAVLQQAVAGLAAELAHYCAIVQQQDAGIGKRQGIDQVLASFTASWQGRSREDVLANMALVHTALLLAVRGRADTGAVEQQLRQMVEPIYAAPIRHDAVALATRVAFRDILKLQISQRSYALDIDVDGDLRGTKVGVLFTESKRTHSNPMRACDYKDVLVRLSTSLANEQMFERAMQALAVSLGQHQLTLEPSAQADMRLALHGQLGCGSTLLLRFYRPQYQQREDFPAHAAGYRLQLLRLEIDSSHSMGLSLPVQPGLTLGLGGAGGATRVLYESWGDNSLTAPMMHYLHLQAINEPERWQVMCKMQRRSLSRLLRRLADEHSAVHQEACYFLRAQPQDGFATRFFAAMRGFDAGTVSVAQAQAVLDTFLERQYPLWQADKQAFAGRLELPA